MRWAEAYVERAFPVQAQQRRTEAGERAQGATGRQLKAIDRLLDELATAGSPDAAEVLQLPVGLPMNRGQAHEMIRALKMVQAHRSGRFAFPSCNV